MSLPIARCVDVPFRLCPFCACIEPCVSANALYVPSQSKKEGEHNVGARDRQKMGGTHPDPDQHLLPFPLIAAPLVPLIQTPHGRVLGHDALGDRVRHARQRREHLDVRVLEVFARDDLVFGRAEHGNVRVLQPSVAARQQQQPVSQYRQQIFFCWGRVELMKEEGAGSLIGFLTDVERDLLEPVDRLRDLVDADEHAASLHLKPVRKRPKKRTSVSAVGGVSPIAHPDERTGWLAREGGERAHLINANSRSSLLGCPSPIPGSFFTALAATAAAGSSTPPAARIEFRYCSCRARSRSRARVPRPYSMMNKLTCGGRKRDWIVVI